MYRSNITDLIKIIVLGIEQCPLYALLTKKQVRPAPTSLFAHPLFY